jgi:hypothetical protein
VRRQPGRDRRPQTAPFGRSEHEGHVHHEHGTHDHDHEQPHHDVQDEDGHDAHAHAEVGDAASGIEWEDDVVDVNSSFG